MRDATIAQATDEIELLDRFGASLSNALQTNYNILRQSSPAVRHTGEDMEIAARLHNIKQNLNEALEEVARRGYGRVVFVRQEDEAGNIIRHEVYRVSQANAGLPEASILARNSPLGSQIASCTIGEDLEIILPGGERYLVVTSLIDIEGAVQLLHPKPDIKLARFHVIDDSAVDTVRGVRAFLENRAAIPEADVGLGTDQALKSPTEATEPLAERSKLDLFWPSDWSKVIFADEPEAALGAQFFTRTTRQQEEAIRAVRGVTVVQGIAGTGKTSIALGRLKFFANFRSGEHMEDYDLDPNDWADFDSSDMIGFVLSPSLVQYLKQTADDLDMRMRIMDFEEYRSQERQSRRLFGRPYKRSPERNSEIQQTARWLQALGDVACLHLAEVIETIQREPLAKPDTPDGRRLADKRWQEIEKQLWTAGPLRGRIIGLIRRLKAKGDSSRAGGRLRGVAAAVDRDVRLSDQETASLNVRERRAVREAVLNLSLRFFRLLNPTELYGIVHQAESLKMALEAHFPNEIKSAIGAANQTAHRLDERLITDDDVVTALCLNAIVCDAFDRDIKDIPYLRTFSDRVGVFIDEYQDFSEQQIFLMGFRAKRKYRQITVSGDDSQRLHTGGIEHIAEAFPYVTDPIRHVVLDRNFRQSEALAALSDCFRTFTNGKSSHQSEPCGAPLYTYDDEIGFAEFIASKISELPDAASVVVICPNAESVQSWFDIIAPGLESAFRSPIVSDRARLTERLKTHFTTPLEAKGLEFDVTVVPDISEFSDEEVIELNGLYVAVSRPRHAIFLGCCRSNMVHNVVNVLCQRGDLAALTAGQLEHAQ